MTTPICKIFIANIGRTQKVLMFSTNSQLLKEVKKKEKIYDCKRAFFFLLFFEFHMMFQPELVKWHKHKISEEQIVSCEKEGLGL
jgi:hypothetical protein